MSAGNQIAARARQLFRELYGYPPAAVATAPGRMNIIGEHTDYNSGWVLPAAIDRFIGVAFRERRDAQVVLRSERFPAPVVFPNLPSRKRGAWSDYIVGVAHELDGRPGPRPGFDVLVTSDLPTGSGLSSSAALEVAFAVAYLTAAGRSMPPADLAGLCQRAENVFVGARTGIMDQFTAVCARAGNALLLDCRTLQADDIPLPDSRHAFLLVDSKVRHDLASSAYNERRSECERAATALGVESLRDAAESDLERIDDPLLRRRARHVVTENRRVLAAAGALRGRDTHQLGPLLAASHASLRDDFEVSCRELDVLVGLAVESPHVVAARMMGGGFGGSVIVIVEAAAIGDLEHHLQMGYADAFHKSPEFYRVRPVDGTMPERFH